MATLPWDDFPHILRSQQFSRQSLETIFQCASTARNTIKRGGNKVLQGRIIATWFEEPSTRTRWSFEVAAYRLGGMVVSSEMAEFSSSMRKGESIGDTAEMIIRYGASFVVMRLKDEGGVERAAERVKQLVAKMNGRFKDVALINAGDGPGQHPTQAILDLFTVKERMGRIDDIRFVAVGDMKYGRTIRSLVYLSAKFRGIQWTFVSHPELGMRDDIKDYLNRHGVHWKEESDLEKALRKADVVYVTRIQRERFPDGEFNTALYEQIRGQYVVDRRAFSILHPDAIVMHPFPRVSGTHSELPEEVDDDPRMIAHQQAENGIYVRAGMLLIIARHTA